MQKILIELSGENIEKLVLNHIHQITVNYLIDLWKTDQRIEWNIRRHSGISNKLESCLVMARVMVIIIIIRLQDYREEVPVV